MIDVDWGAQRIINLYGSWRKQLVTILQLLGMRSIGELVGRTDCLAHMDYQSEEIDDDIRPFLTGGNGNR
jgi:glutamate synthase domain-containing protein 2